VTLRFKDAIVDHFRHYEGERPSVAKDNYDISFLLRISSGKEGFFRAEILQDLCGEPLNQRGYRVAQTTAPLKENLAAGILTLLNYNPEQEHFLDGMCGSGTFVVEAALIAGNIAPTYLSAIMLKKYPEEKPWSFLKSQWFVKDKYMNENFWKDIELINQETELGFTKLSKMKFKISGNEINEFTLVSAKENIRRVVTFFIMESKNKKHYL
jgi:23S rRNA G2445 N2-methylase RlmL